MQEKTDLLRLELLSTSFRSPFNAYNLYVTSGKISRLHIHIFFLYFIVIAFLVNFLSNFFVFLFYKSFFTSWFNGVWLSVGFYFAFFVLIKLLDSLLILYHWHFRKSEHPVDLFLSSFLPFFASSIFFIFPHPYLWLFPGFSFLYSIYGSVVNLKAFSFFTLKDFFRFSLFVAVFVVSLLFIFALGFKWFKAYP
jgi:hypothetical protein